MMYQFVTETKVRSSNTHGKCFYFEIPTNNYMRSAGPKEKTLVTIMEKYNGWFAHFANHSTLRSVSKWTQESSELELVTVTGHTIHYYTNERLEAIHNRFLNHEEVLDRFSGMKCPKCGADITITNTPFYYHDDGHPTDCYYVKCPNHCLFT